MKHTVFIITAFLMLSISSVWGQTQKVRIFDGVKFYDGYQMENNPDRNLDDGILRHSCSLCAVRLTDEQIASIGGGLLLMNVYVQACCDNYDRIGNINLALVPKGQATYKTDEVERMEIARFITPFMDKNKTPDTVPYSYWMDYLGPLLHDVPLRARYDFWLEFEIFGMPYSARNEIEGCADRSDVFKGTLEFETMQPMLGDTDGNLLVPIVIKKPEYIGNNLNNYSPEATDEIGKTIKTYTFDVPQDVTGGQIVLITSNHGADAGGEEYNRRWHYVYVDDELVLSYLPGRKSCEPYRKYNTQWNGIYGSTSKTDSQWQSFSNWCPGDAIDNRIISLGDVPAGEHKVTISVPDARFNGKKGDIPVSMYFHGATKGNETAGIHTPEASRPEVDITIKDDILTLDSSVDIVGVEIYTTLGKRVYRKAGGSPINISSYQPGIYLVNVDLADGIVETHKIVNKQ